MKMGNGAVLAVAGSKGGVGKTTTSINLSAVLAEQGYEVVLVEMDLAMANIGDFLDIDVGLEGEDPTLHEVLAGTASVVDATYDSPCRFDVVPSGATLQGFTKAEVKAISGALATLRFAYDVVVLDTGAGVTTETMVSLALADETILVSTPRVASVRDTMKTRDLTRQVGGTVAGVVFVKSGTGRSPGVDHIADFLSVDLLGHIPEDGAVPSAQDVGRPVVAVDEGSEAATAYRALGDRVRDHLQALAAANPAVLSTDSMERDESGFAFLDDSPETEDEEDAADGDGPAPEQQDAAAPTDGPHVGASEQPETDRAPPPPRVGTDGSGVQAGTTRDTVAAPQEESDETSADAHESPGGDASTTPHEPIQNGTSTTTPEPDETAESTEDHDPRADKPVTERDEAVGNGVLDTDEVVENGASHSEEPVETPKRTAAQGAREESGPSEADTAVRNGESTTSHGPAENGESAETNHPTEKPESAETYDPAEGGASAGSDERESEPTHGGSAESASATKRLIDRAKGFVDR